MRSSLAVLAASLLAVAAATPCPAAALTPELQKKVQAATFEVVVKKPDKDTLTYEKPLPLELIPYAERTDAYRSIGTAFAIAPDTFVTAAHVITAGVGSQGGLPAIRATDGKVYAIARVMKFAAHEDFAEFTVSGTLAVVPFETNTEPVVDEPIFAVGNALGEGVVIRDGLLTSRTPEQQDGRWKWLRFSAAASPGNSGGPLLDATGRVLGIVIAKSPNENLNYASPIDLALNGAPRATFDTRQSFGLPPILQGTIVAELKDSFPLPLPYAEFARSWLAEVLKSLKANQASLLASQADQLFPRGQSAKLLATLYYSPNPTLVEQDDDRTWNVHNCSNATDTPLPGDGSVWHCPGVGLFRLQYPAGTVDEGRYADSKGFMDLLLKGVKVPRMVGSQAVRITSLGPALQEAQLRDRFGRQWQVRTWALGYADAYVQTMALPTPDGYVGLINVLPSMLLDTLNEAAHFFADYLYVSYEGSLPQWRAFLDRRDLRPAVLEHIKLQYDMGKGLRFDSPRLQLDTSGVLNVSAESSLVLRMTYMVDQGNLTWDVGGVVVNEDRDGKTYLAAYRQPKPDEGAGKEARERWQHMSKRDADYSGTPGHDDHYTTFWIRTVAAGEHPMDAVQLRPLYEVVFNTNTKVLPRQMEDIQGRLAKELRVTE
jgi:serine protease Do